MFSGTIEQNPVGNKVRGTNLYRLDYTAHADYSRCRQCGLASGRRSVVVGYAGKRHHERPTTVFAPHLLPTKSPTTQASGLLPSNVVSSQLPSTHTNSQQSNQHPSTNPTTTSVSTSYYPRIMFIGTAPRGTEDVSGVAFLGHEGRILKAIFKMVPHNFEFYCTYLVACRTGDIIYNGEFTDEHSDIDSSKTQSLSIIDEDRYPSPGEVRACQPHLYDIHNEFAPQFIVHLGSFVNKHAPKLATKRATLVLDSLEYIASLEYRILTVRRNAHRLSELISEHNKAIHNVHKNQRIRQG